jgi:hypothetical protein
MRAGLFARQRSGSGAGAGRKDGEPEKLATWVARELVLFADHRR